VHLVRDPAIALHEVLDESNVAFLRLIDLGPPFIFESFVSDDRRRDDEVRFRLVDVPLTELTIGESGAMPDELVGKRATHALEQK